MPNKYVKVFFQSLGIQIMISIVSMIFFINILTTLYTLFTAWLLMFPLYSIFWKLGNNERKHIAIHNNNLKDDQMPKKGIFYKGALIAMPHFMVNVILLLLTYFTNNDYMLLIETAITFPFAGFLPQLTDVLGTEYLVSRLLACLAMYLPCVLGYITGMLNFSLLDKYYRKIIYKKPSDKEV